MASDDATVADVLRDVCPDECWQMIDYIEMEDICQPEMDYEAWVRPMKLTGGRVCLRSRWPSAAPDVFFTVDGDWLKAIDETGGTVEGPEAISRFKFERACSTPELTPVLREDTPFAEVDDADV